MATLNQRFKCGKKQKEAWKSSVKLKQNPFRKAIVNGLYFGSPKKPNSGKRKLARVTLTTGVRAIVTIPDGRQHGGPQLQKYNKVLIRGGRCRDMPGAHYKILRSTKGRHYETLNGSVNRSQRRSKFGVPKFVKR